MQPWLATIAHRRAVDWVRREEAVRSRDHRAGLDFVRAVSPDVAETVEAALGRERVRSALASLPAHESTPIRQAYFGGRTYRQVALDMGHPEGTVKSRIRSGLRRMAEALRPELDGSASQDLPGRQ